MSAIIMGMNRPVSKKLSKVRRASGTNWAVISTNSPAQIAATIVSSVFLQTRTTITSVGIEKQGVDDEPTYQVNQFILRNPGNSENRIDESKNEQSTDGYSCVKGQMVPADCHCLHSLMRCPNQ